VVEIKDSRKYVKELRATIEGMHLGGALHSKGKEINNPLGRAFSMIGFSSYYIFAKQRRLEQFDYWMAHPN
jgi:hypothetical protein